MTKTYNKQEQTLWQSKRTVTQTVCNELFHEYAFEKSEINYREKEQKKNNDSGNLLIDLCDETKDHPDFGGNGKMGLLTFNEFASQMYIFRCEIRNFFEYEDFRFI